MENLFIDKNGQVVKVGDSVLSDSDIKAHVVSERYVDDLSENVLFVQQDNNPLSFSYLTRENLALQFVKISN